ncbi:hypothetical protein M9H77_28110 [Catharanthus roseus]|uniref:Uncharacterized protein n=2 Tax=Catharanthus roseus TaxID=4058 RepID=A0ACC0AFU6_CATRO|nr:hypothetical protein M9H77_28110 [Catharanthus roseus]
MKVMIPLDESEGSFYALKWVLDHLFNSPTAPTTTTTDLAQSSQEAEPHLITIVHVRQPFTPFIYPAGPVVYATPMVVDAVRKANEEIATRIFSRALHMCKDQKMVKAETLVLEGDPKDRICEVADEQHFDLLVIGSRGLGKIKRAFLGSVSDYCAHHVKCPILIVKPPKESSM